LWADRYWITVTTIPEMIEANRANWDARVPVHLRGYDLDHLRRGGQRLTAFAEHDVTCWGRFPGMTDLGDGWFGWPAGAPRLPLMFSVRAEKP
jgi:hypothetical protein